jgi:hypothetical protein
MKNLKKEENKYACRYYNVDDAEWDDLHEEEVRLLWCEAMSEEYWGEAYDLMEHCYCSTHEEEFQDYLRRNR